MSEAEQAIERLRTLSRPSQASGATAADVEVVLGELERLNAPSEIPCCKCGGEVVEFSVPNEAWNTIVRKGGPGTDQEYLCLDCFARCAAEEVGRLQAIVNALPMCNRWVDSEPVQDVAVVPGVPKWFCDHAGHVRKIAIEMVGSQVVFARAGVPFRVEELYDSLAAAEHASKAKGEG